MHRDAFDEEHSGLPDSLGREGTLTIFDIVSFGDHQDRWGRWRNVYNNTPSPSKQNHHHHQPTHNRNNNHNNTLSSFPSSTFDLIQGFHLLSTTQSICISSKLSLSFQLLQRLLQYSRELAIRHQFSLLVAWMRISLSRWYTFNFRYLRYWLLFRYGRSVDQDLAKYGKRATDEDLAKYGKRAADEDLAK